MLPGRAAYQQLLMERIVPAKLKNLPPFGGASQDRPYHRERQRGFGAAEGDVKPSGKHRSRRLLAQLAVLDLAAIGAFVLFVGHPVAKVWLLARPWF